MKRILWLFAFLLFGFTSAYAQSSGWDELEKIFGRKGTVQGDMIKVTFPRTELKVMVGEVPVDPGLALTSWIGFKKAGKQAMMMGDLVLLEDEVARVTIMLAKEGVEVTALHNHIINEKPGIMYLHFSGMGKPEELAEAMRSALSLTGTPMQVQQTATTKTGGTDWSKVESIFGKSGQTKGNLFQISFPRKETIQEHGMAIPPFLGMATSINMQSAGDKVATTGDFVLLADEVNPVVKALISHNLSVTAIHSHMLHESPRLFFLHFWGYDNPETIATVLKAALDKTSIMK